MSTTADAAVCLQLQTTQYDYNYRWHSMTTTDDAVCLQQQMQQYDYNYRWHSMTTTDDAVWLEQQTQQYDLLLPGKSLRLSWQQQGGVLHDISMTTTDDAVWLEQQTQQYDYNYRWRSMTKTTDAAVCLQQHCHISSSCKQQSASIATNDVHIIQHNTYNAHTLAVRAKSEVQGQKLSTETEDIFHIWLSAVHLKILFCHTHSNCWLLLGRIAVLPM